MTPILHQQNDSPRRVILLRHGQTDWNAQGRWQGREDIPLNDAGLRQSERAAAVLAQDGSITRLVSSPARRAAQTANVLKGALDLAGRPVARELDERLVELDMGEWSGRLYTDIAREYPQAYDAVEAGEDIPRGGHGERLGEAVDRVRAAVEAAIATLGAGDSVVVVTHGAVIRGVAAAMSGMPLAISKQCLGRVGNCHWVTLSSSERTHASGSPGWRIEQWNASASRAS